MHSKIHSILARRKTWFNVQASVQGIRMRPLRNPLFFYSIRTNLTAGYMFVVKHKQIMFFYNLSTKCCFKIISPIFSFEELMFLYFWNSLYMTKMKFLQKESKINKSVNQFLNILWFMLLGRDSYFCAIKYNDNNCAPMNFYGRKYDVIFLWIFIANSSQYSSNCPLQLLCSC